MRILTLLGAASLALVLASPAFAADDSVTGKNASSVTVTFCSKDTGVGVMASCFIGVNTAGTKITLLSVKANASAQSSLEDAMTDPISMDLHRSLRVLNMDSSGNPLDPNAATSAGENHVGEFGGNQIAIAVTPTLTAHTYATGEAMGGLQTLASAERVAGKGGLIQSAAVALKVANTVQIDLYYFNANPSGSTCTNASAFVLAAADIGKVVAVAHVTDWTAGNTASFGQSQNMAAPFVLPSGTSLFACPVARGSIVIAAASDLVDTTNAIRN